MHKIGVVFLSMAVGIVFMFLINYLLIEKMAIPDPCYFHSHEPTFIFNLFYEFNANDGYHPTPNDLNLISTTGLGGLIGLLLFYKLKK
jgi:hypothetical protein